MTKEEKHEKEFYRLQTLVKKLKDRNDELKRAALKFPTAQQYNRLIDKIDQQRKEIEVLHRERRMFGESCSK